MIEFFELIPTWYLIGSFFTCFFYLWMTNRHIYELLAQAKFVYTNSGYKGNTGLFLLLAIAIVLNSIFNFVFWPLALVVLLIRYQDE